MVARAFLRACNSLFVLLQLLNATTTTNAYALVPFARDDSHGALQKRDSSTEVPVTSAILPYVVNVTVGTPGQSLALLIATKSSQTWAPEVCSYWVDDGNTGEWVMKSEPCLLGSYNPSASSSFQPLNMTSSSDQLWVAVDRRHEVQGDWFRDHLRVGDMTFDDHPLGRVNGSGRNIGQLGLAHSSGDGVGGLGVLDRMVWDGTIQTPAYSLWLDNADATSGSLLFGAIDRSRLDGDFVRVSSSVSSSGYPELEVYSIAHVVGDTVTFIEVDDYPIAVWLELETIFSYLPDAIVGAISNVTGARYDDETGLTMIPCNAAETHPARFSLRLTGPEGPLLNFETADLVIPISIAHYQSDDFVDLGFYRPATSNECLFGLQRTRYSEDYSSEFYSIGSSILRRSYMVFDDANSEVAVAPVKFVSDGNPPAPTIEAFASYGARVPSATLYCVDCSASTSATATGDCDRGFWGCPTESPTSVLTGLPTIGSFDGGSSDGNSTSTGGLGQSEKMAIGFGVSFGVLILVALIAAVVYWTRACKGDRRRQKGKEIDDGHGESVHAVLAPVPAPPAMRAGFIPFRKSSAKGASKKRKPSVSTSGPLSPIEERQDELAEGSARAAPQGPEPVVSPAPGSPSKGNSDAVSAISDEGRVMEPPSPVSPEPTQAGPSGETAAGDIPPVPRSPKGKETAVD